MNASVTFGWPPQKLNPNARAHWRIKHKAARRYRRDCWALAKASGIAAPGTDRLMVKLVFRPPTAQRRDLDNLLAAMKHGLDGLAEAIGVDDSRFALTISIGEVDPRRLGAVVVSVEAA